MWYENDYDTRIIHRNLAFPLLKALTKVGDPLAKRKFKEEIATRLDNSFGSVVEYLIVEGYLHYLTLEEFNTVLFSIKEQPVLKGLIQGLKSHHYNDYADLVQNRLNELQSEKLS